MPASGEVVSQSIPVDIEIRRLDTTVAKLRTKADPDDPDVLQRLLVNALKRNGADVAAIGDYELVVRRAGEDAVLMTFVSSE